MKILRIEFENINSLKGKHAIDFTREPFNQSSLFAITGPTGSGKSTILDVISLALFNNIPRMDKVSTNEILKTGAILTRNQTTASAAVTYQGKSGMYRSQWSISTARTGNLREYEMEVANAETGVLFDLKKSEVPAKNEELIGLNYNQFIKSVLLAQGEFAQFLKAKKDERGELLEKITGTGIYRQLGIAAFNRFKEENSGIEFQQNQIAALEGQLLSEEEEKATASNYKAEDEKLKKLNLGLEQLTKKLELKENIKNLKKQLSEKAELQKTAETGLQNFQKEHGQVLTRHEQLEDLAGELRQWQQLTSEIKNLQKDLENVNLQQQQSEQQLEKSLQEASGLVKEKFDPEKFNETLEKFSARINELLQKKNEKGSEFRAISNQLKTEVRELEFSFDESAPESALQQLLELKKTSEAKIEAFRERFSPEEIPEKSQLQEKFQQSRKAWQQDLELESGKRDQQKLDKEKRELKEKVEEIKPKLEFAKKEVVRLDEMYQKLLLQRENQLLRAELEDLRHRLKPGEACPLCGALEHPFSEELPPKDDHLKTQLETTKTQLDSHKTQYSSLVARLEDSEKHLEKLEIQLQQLNGRLIKEQREFESEFAELKPGELSWELFCNTLEEQLKQLELLELENRKLNSLKAATPLLEQLIEVLAAGKKLKQQLEKNYAGKDVNRDCRELSNKWSRLQQEKKNLETRLQEIKAQYSEKKKTIDALLLNLLPELKQKGFEGPAFALPFLLPEVEYRNLRQRRDELKSKISNHRTNIELLESQLESVRKNTTEETEEDLRLEFQQKKEQQQELNESCRDLYSKLKAHQNTTVLIKNLKEEISKKSESIYRWKLLKELIGDSSGKKFNDFAQDLSLSQLLYLANIRLKDLSDRYSIDKPGEGEDDGLVAIDEHMGGQRRSVKTLSGGETFLLSLSMALALSDLASRNVEINSLFIDEGFGTLDPETLDQTLDTLEKLQAESSKIIGIISHVDSLKERIAIQIQLKRNGQGYSSLEIKG